MSPSHVSDTITRIEAHLGVPLLTRSTRSVTPTEAGPEDGFLQHHAELAAQRRRVGAHHVEHRLNPCCAQLLADATTDTPNLAHLGALEKVAQLTLIQATRNADPAILRPCVSGRFERPPVGVTRREGATSNA